MTGEPSSKVQLLPVPGFCQAERSTLEVTGGLSAGMWCLLGDTGSWTVPVLPATHILGFCTGVSAPGSDFICSLSFERPLGEPQVRARGALCYF